MFLAADINSAYRVILSRGHKLTDKDIAYLGRMFPDKSFPVERPEFEQGSVSQPALDKREKDQLAYRFQRKIDTVANKAQSLLHNSVALDPRQLEELDQAVQKMLKFIQDNPLTMNIMEKLTSSHSYLQMHGMNVFYFSLLLGYVLLDFVQQNKPSEALAGKSWDVTLLTPLATAAIFHDLGMLPIQHIYDKKETLSEQDKNSIRVHPLVGFDKLPEQISEKARHAVLHHHENFDGSGYVHGLTGEQINIFSRILRIADSYTAATTNKSYRQAKDPILALYEILHGEYCHCYDPVLVKLFAAKIQAFPIGAKIKLSNKKWAVVVRHNPHNPFLPELITAFDEKNRPIPKKQLAKPFVLNPKDNLRLVSFGQQDLSFLKHIPKNLQLADHYEYFSRACSEIPESHTVSV